LNDFLKEYIVEEEVNALPEESTQYEEDEVNGIVIMML
jgi:hypothetical protein